MTSGLVTPERISFKGLYLKITVNSSRGRDIGYPIPPAQIPSMRNYRTGLLPQVKRRDVDSGMGVALWLWESTSSSVVAYDPMSGFYLSGFVCAGHATMRDRFVFGKCPMLLGYRGLRSN